MKIKIVFLLLAASSVAAYASENTVQAGLRLEQAMFQVLENHPKLRVADYEAQAIAARLRKALLPPADRLNMSLEDFAGSGNARDVRGIEATLSLSRILELGNKTARRGDIVERQAYLQQNKKDIDRLDLMAETARRFVHIAADQHRLKIAEDAIDLIRLTQKTVEERIRVGKTPTTERQRIAIDMANYELELDHKRHEMESSRIQLASLWNDRRASFERVSADIFRLESLPDFETLADFLERNPDLVRYIREEDLARAKIRLAQSKRKSDLELSAGLRYLGNSDDVALMFSASMPLGTAGRAQHEIDEAEALARIEPLNLEQRRMELYATLFEIYQELKHARDAVGVLTNKVIPTAEKMLAAYEEGFQAGRYSLLELILVQQQLRNARSQSVEMATNYHKYRIEIDRLTGAQTTKW